MMFRSIIAIAALAACSGAVSAAETDKKTEWDCTPTATQFIGEVRQSQLVQGIYPSGPDVLLASKHGLDPVVFTFGEAHPSQVRNFNASVIKVRWKEGGYYYLDEMSNKKGFGQTCVEYPRALECRAHTDGWPQNFFVLNKRLGLYSFHVMGGYVGRDRADQQLLDREWMSVGTCEESNPQAEDES